MRTPVNNLDILRAFAVLCVFIAHLFRHVLGIEDLLVTKVDELGQFGVVVFFVHTSLVLLMSLDRTQADRPWLNFYIRRAFRIYPLSIAVILMVLYFHIPFMPERAYEWIGFEHVLSNLTLTQNVIGGRSLIGPLWSLPYEVQMYLLLPYIHHVLSAQRSTTAILVMWSWATFVRLFFLAVIANTIVIHFIPCFLGGAVAYQLRRSRQAHVLAHLWPVALIVLFFGHAWLWNAFPSVRVLADYAVCLAIGLVMPSFQDLKTSRFTVAGHIIAKYSYGIYLFHAPVMWLSFFCIPVNVPVQWMVFGALSVAAPWVAYHVLEAPMVAMGQMLADHLSNKKRAVMLTSTAAVG
jgi:peptidoglycan/LPS O-acetylase OafA/YrhL